MDSIINLQKKIVPELTDLLVQRYQILRQVSHESPIGRRALAGKLGLSERVLRAQVDFLKKSGLLAFSASGMSVTDEGADILKELADYVRKLRNIVFKHHAVHYLAAEVEDKHEDERYRDAAVAHAGK